MNTETQRNGKMAMKNVLTDVQNVLNEYVEMIANDQVSFEDFKSVVVIRDMADMLIAIVGHMHMDRLDDYDNDKLREIALNLTKFTAIKESCEAYLNGDNEEE